MNKLTKGEDMKNKFKPFRNFWTRFPPEFIVLIRHLMGLIRGGKSEILEKEQDVMLDYEACLSNWKIAQKIMSFEIIFRLDDIIKLEAKKKEHHRNRNKEEKVACIYAVTLRKNEILVLRRCIDSLIWSMLDNEPSSIRRLPITPHTDNLSRINIIDSMIAADLINEHKHKLAVVTDMSTFVHIGDLATFSLQEGFQLIEVKTGKRNHELYEAALKSFTSDHPTPEDHHINNMSEKDVNQFNRIKKQIVRGNNVLKAIYTGEGFDNLSQSPIKIYDRNFVPTFYNKNLIHLWETIFSGKNWAIDVIDDCLYLGAYRDAEKGFLAFSTWMDGIDIKSKVVNINYSFFDPLSRLFMSLNLPTELLFDIISGELIIIMCFDHQQFFNRANSRYPGLFYLSDEEESTENTLFVGNQGIASDVDGCCSFVGNGYEIRILFDLQRPDNLIDWSYELSDLKIKKQ